MIRVDERNLVRTADRLPRNLGSRAIGAEDHPRTHGNIGAASFGLDDDDGIAILITLDATKRSRQTRRAGTFAASLVNALLYARFGELK